MSGRRGFKEIFFARRQGSAGAALIPAVIFVLGALIVYPRAVEPQDIPLPRVQGRVLAAVERHDEELARTELSDTTRELGRAIRSYFTAQAEATRREDLNDAAAAMQKAQQAALGAGREPALLALRAVQLDLFMHEVRMFELTGKESADLIALSGRFTGPMRKLGWVRGQRLLVDRHALRVAYKVMWNSTLGLDQNAKFHPTLDEWRAFYSYMITNPPLPDDHHLDEMRASAKTSDECMNIRQEEQASVEYSRLERVRKLADLDPEYPRNYALGIAYFRTGRYPQSVQSFRDWLQDHPTGAYASRAQNFMRAALRREAGPS